jgi:hypothetical protein
LIFCVDERRAVQRLGAAAVAYTDALSAYHAAPGSGAPAAAAAPRAVVVAVDGCVVGVQPRTTRRRRPTKAACTVLVRRSEADSTVYREAVWSNRYYRQSKNAVAFKM